MASRLQLDRCSTPRCRGTRSIEYLGRVLCERCWLKICKESEAHEAQYTNDPVEEEALAEKRVVRRRKYGEKTVAVLDMLIEFESMPDSATLQALIEKAQEDGAVSKATLRVVTKVKQELV